MGDYPWICSLSGLTHPQPKLFTLTWATYALQAAAFCFFLTFYVPTTQARKANHKSESQFLWCPLTAKPEKPQITIVIIMVTTHRCSPLISLRNLEAERQELLTWYFTIGTTISSQMLRNIWQLHRCWKASWPLANGEINISSSGSLSVQG